MCPYDAALPGAAFAAIGRNRAVAEFGPVHLAGFVAWATWTVAHILFLTGYRNRILVSAQWLLSYATHERGGRIIVDSAGGRRGPLASVAPHQSCTSVTSGSKMRP